MRVLTCCVKEDAVRTLLSWEEASVTDGIYKVASALYDSRGRTKYMIVLSRAGKDRTCLFFDSRSGDFEPLNKQSWTTEQFIPLRFADLVLCVKENTVDQ